MGVWGPDCFPYLFINVLFSQREADRQTGSYTLLLDDFLCWVNTFQLRSNMSACKVFWINTYRHRQLLDFIAQRGDSLDELWMSSAEQTQQWLHFYSIINNLHLLHTVCFRMAGCIPSSLNFPPSEYLPFLLPSVTCEYSHTPQMSLEQFTRCGIACHQNRTKKFQWMVKSLVLVAGNKHNSL